MPLLLLALLILSRRKAYTDMNVKPGVDLTNLHPRMVQAAGVVAAIYARSFTPRVGSWITVTSGRDGKHSEGSLHYEGRALDFRTRDIVPPPRQREFRDAVASALGPDFDVILEATHLHVEYDP